MVAGPLKPVRDALLVADRDLMRFWKMKYWLAGQVAMNLTDILVFGTLFSLMVSKTIIQNYLSFVVPGVIALTLFASAFSVGREVGVELRREITQYLLSLPVGKAPLVFGRLLGGLARGLIYQAPFFLIAAAVAGPPKLLGIPVALLTSVLLGLTMSGISIALTTLTRDFNLQATIRFVTYYVMFFFSNVFYPPSVLASRAPMLLPVINYSPLSVAVNVYRWCFNVTQGITMGVAESLGLLAAWTAVLTVSAGLLYLWNLHRAT
ncbi:MAG: ABC transporter permease [Desulfurococcaceae archaeon]